MSNNVVVGFQISTKFKKKIKSCAKKAKKTFSEYCREAIEEKIKGEKK